MKYAAYTEETIWAIGDSEAEARAEGESAMQENDVADQIGTLRIAPINEDLVDALEEAEETEQEVLFELIDGELCEVEVVEA